MNISRIVVVGRADNLASFMCQLSGNLRASTSWKTKSLHMPVQGLLYLYIPEISY